MPTPWILLWSHDHRGLRCFRRTQWKHVGVGVSATERSGGDLMGASVWCCTQVYLQYVSPELIFELLCVNESLCCSDVCLFWDSYHTSLLVTSAFWCSSFHRLLEEELEISEVSVLLCPDHIASVSVTGPFHSPSERTGSIEVQPRGAVKMLLLFHFSELLSFSVWKHVCIKRVTAAQTLLLTVGLLWLCCGRLRVHTLVGFTHISLEASHSLSWHTQMKLISIFVLQVEGDPSIITCLQRCWNWEL